MRIVGGHVAGSLDGYLRTIKTGEDNLTAFLRAQLHTVAKMATQERHDAAAAAPYHDAKRRPIPATDKPPLDNPADGAKQWIVRSFTVHRLLVLIAASLFLFTTQAEDSLPYRQAKDVVYGEIHGTGLLMDVFTPITRTNGVAIVDVVSGAWSSDRNKIRDHTLAQIYTILCGRGYTVFAVRPGSKSRYTLAEMDQNLKTGLRFIKQHAADHGVDPTRLGMTGASAGGQLASLAALTPEPGKPEAKEPAQRQDTRVKAIAVFFPPTDFVEWDTGKPADPKMVLPLLFLGGGAGHSEDEITAKARAVSPLHRVTKPELPFLIFHGDADPMVPLSHSKKLVAAINQAGGSAELVVKPGGGHPWLTLPEEVQKMADWFDKQLLRTGTQL